MVLAGVYELTRCDGLPRETFRLMHQSIAGLELARVTLNRSGRSRYTLVTRALFYVDSVEGASSIRPVSAGAIIMRAFGSLGRKHRWLQKLRWIIKGCLRRNLRAFEDVLEADGEALWTENVGHLGPDELRFDDGFRLDRTTIVVRREEFTSTRLALYAHFDGGPDLSTSDVQSLAHLRAVGYDVVVLSTSLSASAAKSAKGVNAVLVRPNVGHDFLSWRLGLEEFLSEVKRARYVVFTNNSMEIQGEATLLALRGLSGPLVCLTDSYQVRHHAESVWWQIDMTQLPLDVVRVFFAQVVAFPGKQAIIRAYEIGFTEYLESAGFSIKPLWPYERVVAELQARRERFADLYRRLHTDSTLNPSKHLYRLLKDLGVDILKKTSKLDVA